MEPPAPGEPIPKEAGHDVFWVDIVDVPKTWAYLVICRVLVALQGAVVLFRAPNFEGTTIWV